MGYSPVQYCMEVAYLHLYMLYHTFISVNDNSNMQRERDNDLFEMHLFTGLWLY